MVSSLNLKKHLKKLKNKSVFNQTPFLEYYGCFSILKTSMKIYFYKSLLFKLSLKIYTDSIVF